MTYFQNVPNEVWQRLHFGIKALVWIISRIPEITITSTWRSPEHNREVGGIPTSKHLKGRAIDIVIATKEAEAMFIPFVQGLGFEAIFEQDHWHIEI